jgi:toxin ParE1/3/4
MYRLELSIPSRSDVKDIWKYTYNTYGLEQAESYALPITEALYHILENPKSISSRRVTGQDDSVRSYHISLSKSRSESGIKSPRHVIIYVIESEEKLLVLRILHDEMDIPHRLTDE